MPGKELILKGITPFLILIAGIVLLAIPETLDETDYLDYSSNNIQQLVKHIEEISDSKHEKIVNTARFINDNIEYELTGPKCIDQTASEVLREGKGDCVSTSKLAASVLSAMKIPVLIVEGCVFDYDRETKVKYTREFQIPIDENVKVPYEVLGREGHGRIGQLHSWIRAHDGLQWYTIETTAGAVFPVSYEVLFGYNKYGGYVNAADPFDLCLLTDMEYVQFCSEP